MKCETKHTKAHWTLFQLWTILKAWSQEQKAQIWIERACMQRTDYRPCRHRPGLEQMHLLHIVTSSATTLSHGSITKRQVWAWMSKGRGQKTSLYSSESQFLTCSPSIHRHWSYMSISNMRRWKSFTHRWFSMLPSQFSGIYSALQVRAYIDGISAVHFGTNDGVNCPT